MAYLSFQEDAVVFFEEPSSNRPGNHLPAPNGLRLKVRVEEEIVGVPNESLDVWRVSQKNPPTFAGRATRIFGLYEAS